MEQRKTNWRTNPVVGIAAIVLVILVIFVGRSCTKRRGTPVLKTATFFAIDEENGEIFEMKMKISELDKMPYKSPRSGKNTVYRALQCQKCMFIYPWKEKAMPDNKCPNCGSNSSMLLAYDPGKAGPKKE